MRGFTIQRVSQRIASVKLHGNYLLYTYYNTTSFTACQEKMINFFKNSIKIF